MNTKEEMALAALAAALRRQGVNVEQFFAKISHELAVDTRQDRVGCSSV